MSRITQVFSENYAPTSTIAERYERWLEPQGNFLQRVVVPRVAMAGYAVEEIALTALSLVAGVYHAVRLLTLDGASRSRHWSHLCSHAGHSWIHASLTLGNILGILSPQFAAVSALQERFVAEYADLGITRAAAAKEHHDTVAIHSRQLHQTQTLLKELANSPADRKSLLQVEAKQRTDLIRAIYAQRDFLEGHKPLNDEQLDTLIEEMLPDERPMLNQLPKGELLRLLDTLSRAEAVQLTSGLEVLHFNTWAARSGSDLKRYLSTPALRKMNQGQFRQWLHDHQNQAGNVWVESGQRRRLLKQAHVDDLRLLFGRLPEAKKVELVQRHLREQVKGILSHSSKRWILDEPRFAAMKEELKERPFLMPLTRAYIFSSARSKSLNTNLNVKTAFDAILTQNWEINPTAHDGACLFHSLVHQADQTDIDNIYRYINSDFEDGDEGYRKPLRLTGEPATRAYVIEQLAADLREAVCNYIDQNRDSELIRDVIEGEQVVGASQKKKSKAKKESASPKKDEKSASKAKKKSPKRNREGLSSVEHQYHDRVDEYLDLKRKRTEWGGLAEIIAASRIMKRTVVCFSTDSMKNSTFPMDRAFEIDVEGNIGRVTPSEHYGVPELPPGMVDRGALYLTYSGTQYRNLIPRAAVAVAAYPVRPMEATEEKKED